MCIFVSEFRAMKSYCENLRGLRYNLRMFGIQVEHPFCVLGDNPSILSNQSKPHSSLKKKHLRIFYCFDREGVTNDEWRTMCVDTHLNPSERHTKSFTIDDKRTLFTGCILFYLE